MRALLACTIALGLGAALPATSAEPTVWFADKVGAYGIDARALGPRHQAAIGAVSDLVADSQGGAWVCSGRDVARLRPRGSGLLRVPLARLGLAGGCALRAHPYDGGTFVGDGSRLVRLDAAGREVQAIAAPEPVRDFAVGPDETLWLLGDGALWRFETRETLAATLLESWPLAALTERPDHLVLDPLRRRAWLLGQRLSLVELDGGKVEPRAELPQEVRGAALDPRTGTLFVLSRERLAAWGPAGDARTDVALAALGVTDGLSLDYDSSTSSLFIGHGRGLVRYEVDSRRAQPVANVSRAPRLSAPPLGFTPRLILIAPLEGPLTPASIIVIGLEALCHGTPCGLPGDYLARYEIEAALAGERVGLRFVADPAAAEARHTVGRLPGEGPFEFEAQATDPFGRTSNRLRIRFAPSSGDADVPAEAPVTAGGFDSGELDAASAARQRALGGLAVHFERNVGYLDGAVRYHARGSSFHLLLSRSETVLRLRGASEDDAEPAEEEDTREPPPSRSARLERAAARPAGPTVTLRLIAEGANPRPTLVAEELLTGRSHYLLGDDPTGWRTDVRHYGRVRYRDVYPGIDKVFHASGGGLEYDWIVAPGKDPGQIRERVVGASRVEVDAIDDLVIHTAAGPVRQKRPLLYQEVNGRRIEVEGGYRVEADGAIAYAVPRYDASHPLVIDPVLHYWKTLEGTGFDEGLALAVDAADNAYVTGTPSPGFPVVNPLPGGTQGNVFVSKLSPDGTLLFSTFIGDSGGPSRPKGIAVDGKGSAYVVGTTFAKKFPKVKAFQTALKGESDGFLFKLAPAGNAFVYSTLLGGTGRESVNAVAVDAAGNAYLTGDTSSKNFPLAKKMKYVVTGVDRAFVTKVAPAGKPLVYSSYVGGKGKDGNGSWGNAIAVDALGNAYLAGTTQSSSLPVSKVPLQGTIAGLADAFVAKVDPKGSDFLWATYLGGSDWDRANAIAVASSGEVYVAGDSLSRNFPSANPLQEPILGFAGFVAKLQSSGNAFAYSTFVGGNRDTFVESLAIDPLGHAYLAGATLAWDFPGPIGLPAPWLCQATRAYVLKLHRDGGALGFARDLTEWCLDSRNRDAALGVAANAAGHLFVTGTQRRYYGPGWPIEQWAFAARYLLSNDTVQVTSSLNPSQVGDAVTLAAEVDGFGPTGNVTFESDGLEVGTVPLDSRRAVLVTSSLPLGTHALVARYSGDGNNPPSVSAPLSQLVEAAAVPTTTVLSVVPTSIREFQSATVTATVTGNAPGGTVTFRNGSEYLTGERVLVNGQVVAILSSMRGGLYEVAAHYSGDRFNLPSVSSVVPLTVTARPKVVLTSPPPETTFTLPASIPLVAEATPGVGTTIARVEFHASGVLLATDTEAPYEFTWAAPLGVHHLLATVYDALGQGGSSFPTVNIRVQIPTEPGETLTFLHSDLAGSAIGATDETGSVIWRESYRPYGDRLWRQQASATNRQFFHGKPEDSETGLQYFGARYYDPFLGRFCGVDSANFKESNLHSFNRYAYGNNNPLKFLDPDGREAVVVGDRIHIRPADSSIPAITLPNNVGAKGIDPSSWTFHTYDVHTPSGLASSKAQAIGEGIRNNPVPLKGAPASPTGTVNDVGPIPTAGDHNYVRSYSVSSPDPSRYTDLTVNYTIAGQHSLAEGFVIRFGEISNGSITLRSYGEGSNWRQAPILKPAWGPKVNEVWGTNHQEVIQGAQ